MFAPILLFSLGILAQNAFADTVVATIPLGNTGTSHFPEFAGVNPYTNMIYVTRGQGNSIDIINGTTNTLVDTIPIGTSSLEIAVNQNTNLIYVSGGTDLIVINGTTNSIVTQISNVGFPIGVNPDTNMIYTAYYDSGQVSVINGTNNKVVSTISVGGNPTQGAVNPSTNTIYVGLAGTLGKIVEIDGTSNSVVKRIDVAGLVNSVGVNPSTNKIYVSLVSGSQSTLDIFDGSTLNFINGISNLAPDGIGANPTTNKIYAPNSTDNTVSVIDGSTDGIINKITVGCGCDTGLHTAAVNPNTNMIYVVNEEDSTVSVINGNPPQSTTSQLQVNSQDSYGNTITGFSTKLYAQNGTQIDSGITPNNFTLDNGQTYTVHVGNSDKFKFNHWLDTSSTNANRTISITSDQSITAVYATIPTHPSNLTATAVSPSEIDLRWNAPSSDGGSPITGYRIQSSTDGTTWTTIVKNTGNTSTTYSDTGLSPSTTYYYRVFALNSVGSSYRSNIASATTPILTVTGGSITLGNVQSTSGTTSSTNQMTLSSFNAGKGSNQLLLVGVSANNNNVTSVTFGGVPLTRAAYSFYNNDAEFWYLANPTGSGDITVTMYGPTQAVVGAYAFSGVNQTLPIPTHVVKHNTSPNSPNISLTTKYANDWVLDLSSIYGGSTLGSSTCTQQWNSNIPNAITGASSSVIVQTPGAVTCSWTASSGDLYDDAAVEINAVR